MTTKPESPSETQPSTKPEGRLAHQLIVPMAVIFVIVAALTSGLGYLHERTVHFREFDHKLMDSAELLQAAFDSEASLAAGLTHVNALIAKLNASGRDNHLLVLRDASGAPLTAGGGAVLSQAKPFAVSGKTFDFQYGGGKWRGVSVDLETTDQGMPWSGALLYAEPKARVEAALIASLGMHLAIGLLLLVLLGFSIYGLLRRAVLRPLEALDYHVRVTAGGRIEPARYVSPANNEIERIHLHFNEIVDKWRSSQPPRYR